MGSFRQKPRFIFSLITIFTMALILNTFIVSAVDTYYSNYYPVKGSSVTVSNPKISVYVKSIYELNDSSVKLWINGVEKQATFMYKGVWVDDYETDQMIWTITNRKEGTISFNASNLNDLENTVEVSITDKANPPNVITDTWKFTVKEPPKFNNISPADKSKQTNLNQLTSIVSDNTGVNWDNLKLKINNVEKSPLDISINRETGAISYDQVFQTGSYTAVLEVKDSLENIGTITWNFVVDSSPPEIVTGFMDGKIITDGPLKINIQLKDLLDIKENAKLKLDDIDLPVNFRFEGYVDKYYGNYIITSRKIAYLSYEGMVSNGNHKLELYTEDELGNQITRLWNFSVAVKPEISNVSPFKYGVADLKPTISAVVKSPNGTINPESIVLKIDDNIVRPNYNQSTGLVSYTPEGNLKNESNHTVKLSVNDESGYSLEKEWRFYTNTYPDMSDSNYTACIACHDTSSFAGSNGVLEDVHKSKLYFGGTHSRNRCSNCHNYITVPAGCSQCHDDPDGTAFAYSPHGSTPTIHYQPKNVDPAIPLRVTENREMNDCIICHQPGSGVKGYEGYLAQPTRLLNNHDIPELHKTSDESCTKCHAQSLTHEHAREDRTDKDGNSINCNTCHQSTDPKLVQAITNKDTSCSACHGEASHDELHVYEQMDSNCVGCHTNTLTKAHKAVNVTCANCHESQDQVVLDAIANKNKACQTCHTNPLHQNQHMDCATCHKEPLPKINMPVH